MSRRLSPMAREDRLTFWCFVSPWLIGFILLTAGPILASVWLSFTNYSLFKPPEWVGWNNYRELLRDPLILKSLGNTLFYVLFAVPLGTLAASSLGGAWPETFAAAKPNSKIKGVQIGAQSFGYALFFTDEKALDYLDRSDGWEVGVGPTVVVLDKGAAQTLSTTTAKDDIYAFTFNQEGLMAGIGIEGYKITRFEP